MAKISQGLGYTRHNNEPLDKTDPTSLFPCTGWTVNLRVTKLFFLPSYPSTCAISLTTVKWSWEKYFLIYTLHVHRRDYDLELLGRKLYLDCQEYQMTYCRVPC